MSQLDVFLFSHFHVDHSGDFPALVFSSWFEDRKRPLPIYGPPGNEYMPSTTEFVHDLFSDPHGAWRYLSELVDPGSGSSYKIAAAQCGRQVRRRCWCFAMPTWPCMRCASFMGRFPRWRGEWKLAASGSSSAEIRTADGDGLTQLALNADLFVAHNAVPEGATGVERRLHMPPSVIGAIAANAHVKQLVLSHRMLRTLGKERETEAEIRHDIRVQLHSPTTWIAFL